MAEGDIPGLTLVVVRGRQTWIGSFGYADLDPSSKVTPQTTFELASCSKSFTALAALQLAKQKRIRLDDPVAAYLPYFRPAYGEKQPAITLRQLLHHTSGIGWNTIATIPEGTGATALEQTARNVASVALAHAPGKVHEYATVNYDIIGAVIEKVTGLPYEKYMQQHIFAPLGLPATSVGSQAGETGAASGHKVGFFQPLEYEAPVYRGNYPAGYIRSNGQDMARWLRLQLGLLPSPLDSLIRITHLRDETVPPDKNFLTSYAMGWEVSLRGDGEISHEGLNPNFSASVKLFPDDGLGIAVLANSNSNYTYSIANRLAHQFRRGEATAPQLLENEDDQLYSIASLALGCYCLVVLAYLIRIFVQLSGQRRAFQPPVAAKLLRVLLVLLLLAPLLSGIYLLPEAASGVDWDTALVWSPVSFLTSVVLVLAAVFLSYNAYALSLFFPVKKKYTHELPLLIVLSIFSGLANGGVIFLIVHSLHSGMKPWLLLLYLGLALFVYITGRKVVETKLTQMALRLIYDIRIKLVDKIFATAFQHFEKIDRGQVYATLNDDTNGIGNAARITVEVITSVITIVFAFLYLSVISGWATLLTLLTIGAVAALYHVTSRQSEVFFEGVRDTRNSYMRLINGLLDGFKELSLHRSKKDAYKRDIHQVTESFRNQMTTAQVKFIDSFLVGESLLIIVLIIIVLVFPVVFPQIAAAKLVSFMMVLLYLIGPITAVLNAIPALLELKVSWRRINRFIEQVPATESPATPLPAKLPVTLESIAVENIGFRYKTDSGDFAVGPISFEANRGEIFFIAGGNGSGKTTLAKLITGLYAADEGCVRINGRAVAHTQLGEYYSAVFGDFYLFEKLYTIDCSTRQTEIQALLQLLELEKKVTVTGDTFSTIQLSTGQKKRLALLRCYLENKPIYLFDEWAADQDVEFRRFFYEELLLQMKKAGKIVIAITHDEQYYDKADKIMFLEYGKVKILQTVS